MYDHITQRLFDDLVMLVGFDLLDPCRGVGPTRGLNTHRAFTVLDGKYIDKPIEIASNE